MINCRIIIYFLCVEVKLSCVLQPQGSSGNHCWHTYWRYKEPLSTPTCPHCLITFGTLDSKVPVPLPTAAWGFYIPYWCSAGVGCRIYSSLHGLHTVRTPRCADLWIYWLHSLVLSLPGLCDQKRVSQSMSFTRSTSSLLYLYLCLSHSGKSLNGLAWHHGTSGIVVKRSDPENMQLCIRFYAHE